MIITKCDIDALSCKEKLEGILRDRGEKWARRKVVQKYVGYLGKDMHSDRDIELGNILPYVTRLLDKSIIQEDIFLCSN